MRLKLTVEYDGTGFRGWARQPGERTVEGELRRALDELVRRRATGLAVAGRTDTGVHALANVVSVDVEGGPPPERAAEALNAALPDDVAVVRSEQAPDDVPRAVRRARPLVPLPRLAAPRALGARGEARAVVAAAVRRRGGGRERAGAARRARLPGVHADRHAARGVRARREAGAVGGARRGRRRVRDHRRLVPAAHGADAGRDDARGPRPRAAPRRPPAQRGGRDGAAARPVPHARVATRLVEPAPSGERMGA